MSFSNTSELVQPGKMSASLITDNSSLRELVFAMKFSWKTRDIGTVLIKPDKNFYFSFIEGLAKFCFASPSPFSGKIKDVSSI